MKKAYFLLAIVLILFTRGIKAQNNDVPDTLTYLQSIIANKSQFVGKPFSVLRDSLKIAVKSFYLRRNIHYDISKETSTRINFYFPKSEDELYLAYPYLEIYWQTPLNAMQSDVLWVSNNGGGWSSTVAAFYANGIVRDIRLRE